MMRSLIIFGALAALAAPAAAQEFEFSMAAFESCLAGRAPGEDARTCIGASADACMATDAGGTTVGMGACLSRELSYWDDRLNRVYGAAMTKARAIDTEMNDLGSAAPPQAPALRDMQRAWITFRDAKCDHARSLWGGGTGGGPATVDCLMQTTGVQVMYLEKLALGD